MKVLFLTSRIPYPPHRGDKLKIYNLIKRTSRRHEVSLLTFVESEEEARLAEHLRPLCKRIEVVVLPKWRSYLQCLWALPHAEPLQVAYFSSSAMRTKMREMVAEGQFDVLHVHLIRMAQYARSGDGLAPRVLDLTDAGSLYLRRFLRTTREFGKRLILREELRRLSRYERILEAFDLSLVCSPVDQEVLRGHAPRADVRLLFNGVDLEYFTPTDGTPKVPQSIVFTGNMSYFPNEDGASFLVDEIMPLVWKRYPDARAALVGQSPPASVRRLASERVEVTGFAEDIRTYYQRSAVAVASVRFGAGTLNKVLEPMALGIPVVATSVAIEGLPVVHGEHLLVANSTEEFAAAIGRLFEDPELAARIGKMGQALVRERYDWDVIANDLQKYYDEITLKR